MGGGYEEGNSPPPSFPSILQTDLESAQVESVMPMGDHPLNSLPTLSLSPDLSPFLLYSPPRLG